MNDMPHQSLEIPSEFEYLEQVLVFIEQFVEKHQLDADLLDKLMLLGSEAATNAMEHGNQFDPKKRVFIELSLNARHVSLSIEDEGEGFEPKEDVPDPLAEENLFNEGGRGVFLMNELANEVHFEKGGRLVRMLFNLEEQV